MRSPTSRPECSCECWSFPAGLEVLAVIVGISELVQRAADHRLRLVALGDDHGRQAMVSRRDPAVAADEIDVVRPLHQELGHDRIIVVCLGEMAVGARLGVGMTRKIGAGFGGRPFWFCGCLDRGRPAARL